MKFRAVLDFQLNRRSKIIHGIISQQKKAYCYDAPNENINTILSKATK